VQETVWGRDCDSTPRPQSTIHSEIFGFLRELIGSGPDTDAPKNINIWESALNGTRSAVTERCFSYIYQHIPLDARGSGVLAQSTTMSSDKQSIEHHEQPAFQGRARSLTTVTLTPEQFESLYLQPRNAARGDLASSFGNATPL
jgi:hypothetical protein